MSVSPQATHTDPVNPGEVEAEEAVSGLGLSTGPGPPGALAIPALYQVWMPTARDTPSSLSPLPYSPHQKAFGFFLFCA